MRSHFVLKAFALAVLSTNCFSLVNAQSPSGQFAEGYYINNTHDTIRGSILYKNWEHSPASISFRQGTSTIELTPVNAKEIYINQYDTYISYSGKRMTNPTTAHEAWREQKDSTSQFVDEPIFLRKVREAGTIGLYLYSSASRQNFFLHTPGTQPEELLFKMYVENRQEAEFRKYRQQLQAAFGQQIHEKNLSRSLERLDYHEPDMLRFFSKLSGKESEKKKSRYPSQFGVIGGVSVNMYDQQGEGANLYGGNRYASTISPVAGISYIAYTQRNFGKYFINMQLLFTSYNFEGSNTIVSSKVHSGLLTRLNLLPGINIINRKNAWHVAAGASALFYTNNGETREPQPSGEPYEVDYSKSFTFSGTLQTGVVLNKRLMVWANYLLPVNVTNYVYMSGSYSSFSAGIGWNLKK